MVGVPAKSTPKPCRNRVVLGGKPCNCANSFFRSSQPLDQPRLHSSLFAARLTLISVPAIGHNGHPPTQYCTKTDGGEDGIEAMKWLQGTEVSGLLRSKQIQSLEVRIHTHFIIILQRVFFLVSLFFFLFSFL
jgi:hypothetical protein